MYLFLLLVSLLISPSSCHSPEIIQAYRKMKSLVESPMDPKGVPFRTSIPGPKSFSDKIAIIGAGPSGLHMAYLLQEKGFKNVIVMEKMKRFGGRVYSVPRRGAMQEMGACYTSPDFEHNLLELADELGIRRPVDIPSATIWVDEVPNPMSFAQYIFLQAIRTGSVNSTDTFVSTLLNATTRYIQIHRDLFGKYEGELMRRPLRKTMRKLDKDFLSFLKDNDLEILKPIFLATQTMQGFGQLDEVSVIYALMWNTPNLILRMVARSLSLNGGAIGVFPDGFETIWKRLVAERDIDVRVSVKIEKIIRKSNRGVFIHYSNGTREKFDWLIWTASANKLLNLIPKPTRREKKYFLPIKREWITTTLFESTYGKRGTTPIDYWYSSLLKKEDHGLWAQRDSYGVLQQLGGKEYQEGDVVGGSDGMKIRTGVAYQHGSSFPPLPKLRDDLIKHFEQVNATNITIIKQIPWPYFPRFSIKKMSSGILWDIFNLQGIRRTWYSGASVIFETVKSVMEYNKMLVERLKIPEE